MIELEIIILDDHKIFGESLSKLLNVKFEDSKCVFVSKVVDFFYLLDKNDYDMCLIDINLNNSGSGFDVLKILNKNKYNIKKLYYLHIIILSIKIKHINWE